MIDEKPRTAACIARGSEFYDSVFPVVFCNDDMTVVDMNCRAAEKFENTLRGADFSAYLGERDARNLRALLNLGRTRRFAEEPYIETEIVHLKDARYSLAVLRTMFGRNFAEIRLFRSRKEMLSSYDSLRLMLPVKPLAPEYPLARGREGNEETANELNEVFAGNMLSNLYHSARSDKEVPELFELGETVRRIASEVSRAFRYNRLKWSVTLKQGEFCVFPVISRRNFINIIALAISIISKVSGDGAASVLVVPEEERAVIEFSAKLEKCPRVFRGDFVFPLIGSMFPAVKTAAEFLVYICNLYGIGCFSEVLRGGTIVLRIVLSEEGFPSNYTVKHLKRFDMTGMRQSIELIRFTDGM